jgi:hypothetical protein
LKAYLNDIIPKIKRYSQKLDDLTLLSNQHWIAIDEFSDTQTKYIFLSNKELIISINGNVKKAKWEYVGNSSIIIEITDKIKLFNIEFYDKTLLALKLDDSNNYMLLINERKHNKELYTINNITTYLLSNYLEQINLPGSTSKPLSFKPNVKYKKIKTNLGDINIELAQNSEPSKGNRVYLKNSLAPDGDYRAGVGWFYRVKDGLIIDICK